MCLHKFHFSFMGFCLISRYVFASVPFQFHGFLPYISICICISSIPVSWVFALYLDMYLHQFHSSFMGVCLISRYVFASAPFQFPVFLPYISIFICIRCISLSWGFPLYLDIYLNKIHYNLLIF